MRIVAYSIFYFLIAFSVVSCMNPHAGTTADASKTIKITENKVMGTYKGELPCTDCEAITTMLSLNDDQEYVLEYVYVGKSSEAFSKTGKWTLENGELDLSGLDYKYKVEAKQLRQLDLSGKEIVGELADRYVLKRF